ncbi:ATP-dependent DNA helicase RecQ [Persicobacter psychrovividus]|uniref:ATP-dependent DNA helicase RecQ n=1 Tax=Persicobacter psychrovividus TaxID=387638 RepID=A0ABM7VEW4_9BACT|nr:ATP-dependent DNA helicase RecQ [Persicobacter psychrovividus]
MAEKSKEILKQYWGYKKFRPLQKDIIQSVIDGHDTLALMPTGGGKSLCFQVPGLLLGGISIVITPLIALMQDQVSQLKKRGIKAYALFSGMSSREIDITLDNCRFGGSAFLYVSPERVQTPLFQARVKEMPVNLIAVDEAHCISQWGYDFRPAYLQIASLRAFFPSCPIIAVTATATPKVQEDIVSKLEMIACRKYTKSFARSNLAYHVREVDDKGGKMLQAFKNIEGSGIVYMRSRQKCEQISQWLCQQGIVADFYHAGLNTQERQQKQADWIDNKTRVIVATNAFGMGIDKPDVRLVIHLDLTDSLEAYYQEAGRAGRDEQKAFALTLYHASDLKKIQKRWQDAQVSPAFIRQVYQSLANQYRLAVGSALLMSYPFDLFAFSKKFNLPPLTTHHALQRLATLGYIQLSENVFRPSKVSFLWNSGALYELQVKNPAFEEVIKALLRQHGGNLYGEFVEINEKRLAKLLHKSTSAIASTLQQLAELGAIDYEPKSDSPQVTFLTARHDAVSLPLDLITARERSAAEKEKLDAVALYVSPLVKCRQQVLLQYFGEENSEPCGVCDRCLEHKKSAKFHQSNEETMRVLIVSQLKAKPKSIEEVYAALNTGNEDEFKQCLKTLLNNGTVVYNSKGLLALHH